MTHFHSVQRPMGPPADNDVIKTSHASWSFVARLDDLTLGLGFQNANIIFSNISTFV